MSVEKWVKGMTRFMRYWGKEVAKIENMKQFEAGLIDRECYEAFERVVA